MITSFHLSSNFNVNFLLENVHAVFLELVALDMISCSFDMLIVLLYNT